MVEKEKLVGLLGYDNVQIPAIFLRSWVLEAWRTWQLWLSWFITVYISIRYELCTKHRVSIFVPCAFGCIKRHGADFQKAGGQLIAGGTHKHCRAEKSKEDYERFNACVTDTAEAFEWKLSSPSIIIHQLQPAFMLCIFYVYVWRTFWSSVMSYGLTFPLDCQRRGRTQPVDKAFLFSCVSVPLPDNGIYGQHCKLKSFDRPCMLCYNAIKLRWARFTISSLDRMKNFNDIVLFSRFGYSNLSGSVLSRSSPVVIEKRVRIF